MVELHKTTGLIESISVDGQKLELEQEIVWYAAKEPRDRNVWTGVNSALYMLQTNQTNPFPIPRQNEEIYVKIFKGFCSINMIKNQ